MEDSPRLFYQVLRLFQLVTDRLWEALTSLGLTPNQYTVLSMVKVMAPVTSASLARRIGVTAQSAGETVKALTEMGLLDRQGVPEHKRLVMLRLSPSGKRMLTRAHRAVAKAEREMFDCLDQTALDTFQQSIRLLRASHQARNERGSGTATAATPSGKCRLGDSGRLAKHSSRA